MSFLSTPTSAQAMASLGRRGVMPHGRCLAALLAVAALASPHRLGAAGAAEASGGKWHLVTVRLLLPSATCTTTEAAPNSSTLSVVHRHGPCSPLRSRGGEPPSHEEILGKDRERVDAIHRKVGRAAASKGRNVTLQPRWGKPLGTSNYFITVGLGTPARNLSVEFDTGSERSWVQCEPCRDCYEQHDPLFDPSKSSTYSAVPCGAHECRELGLHKHNCSSDDNMCRYEVAYADHSKTAGNLARDTLTLTPATTLPGFTFGCGHDDAGVFGELDGLFGFSRGKASLSSQAAAKYGTGFSYCLPSLASTLGYLTLGVASTSPANTQFTAMVAGHVGSSFYYLNLTGIKVAGRAIKVAPTAFATAAGTIIDSGTAFSRLPPRVYAALRSSFRRAMARGRYKRVPVRVPFDTCYDLSGHETVRVPSVELVFGDGATVALHPSGVLYAWDDVAQTCLAFAPSPEEPPLGVLGNVQQRTLAVVYDVGNQKIGFGAQSCA